MPSSKSTKQEVREKFEGVSYPIHIVGRNIEVTESMKSYALEKLAKIDHYGGKVLEVTITMDSQRGMQQVDYLVSVNNKRIKVTGRSKDMYASIDQAIDHLRLIITRYTRRLHEHHALGLKEIELSILPLEENIDPMAEINDQIEDVTLAQRDMALCPGTILKRDKYPLKLYTEKEAVLRMDLLTDPYLLYRAEEDGKVKVLYRLHDGNYGIFEPE